MFAAAAAPLWATLGGQEPHDFAAESSESPTARASLALYNTREEIDALVAALH